jgi:hypothetical protein
MRSVDLEQIPACAFKLAVGSESDRLSEDGRWLVGEPDLRENVPSLSTSGETLTIEVSMNLEGENGERRNVGDEHEWSWAGG